MAEKKDPELTSSQEHTKITTNCQTTTDENAWTYQKRYSVSKDKEETTVRWYKGGTSSVIKYHNP